MGLFGFLRRKDEDAIPKPGTPEFEAMIEGSAIPDAQSVSMGEEGWTSARPTETIDLRGTGAREQVEDVLRDHGIDPDKPGQRVDASSVPGLPKALMDVLRNGFGVQVPNAGGFGGGISPPRQDPLDQVEFLARKRDAGEITEAEFESQKRQLLG
jgi:Short C-terminal domain